ncbi:sulfatase-like hydrolase/transferase [Parasphingorhabdus cellanae]|uniref:Sulfatase-like hydrolase/transferase n=1 Tax=Parasphingorhabdus cellanae TaxID=2806553 RepID=A0ABX7T5R5_9SPHN|nr:sulfatase-like hydrolase/transferase [Parasphingorhabdus cellanae]QTD56934.1 sulfatase-like hydrolase/transferase [Parasphingorhabdus cellanae]
MADSPFGTPDGGPSNGPDGGPDSKWLITRFVAGFLLFSAAYALINQLPLTQSILYRAAAFDYTNAALAGLSFALQALLLFIATLWLSNRWFVLALVLVILSAGINMIYGQIVGDTLDLQKAGWLVTEARQAFNAAGEFASPLALAVGKLLLAAALLIAARRLSHKPVHQLTGGRVAGKKSTTAIMLLLTAPSFLWPVLGLHPLAVERNIYSYAIAILSADPAPPRAVVTATSESDMAIDKIIWLVDESVSYEAFNEIIAPQITRHTPLDFGEAASMGHCSTPSNVALRSGVNVRTVTDTTDLRRTSSIWGYAAKAGYATTMIDGQVSGPPQNLLLPPERALIGTYQSAANGMKTDFAIARSLNANLKADGKQFVYTILRGVHFQYRDHYPQGAMPEGSSMMEQYRKAISYSKQGFFDALLDGVDRSKVAIFYTSDHGQNIEDGVTPHCSGSPVAAEFSVPLIGFLPPDIQQSYASAPGERSHSQLFPTTLALMGYDPIYAADNYDNLLMAPTARYVWFGRGIVPVEAGGRIDVSGGDRFPAQ